MDFYSLNILFNKKKTHKIEGLFSYDVFVFTVNVKNTSKWQHKEMTRL